MGDIPTPFLTQIQNGYGWRKPWEIPIEEILGEAPNDETSQTSIHHIAGNEYFTLIQHDGRYYALGYMRNYQDDYEFIHLRQYNSLPELFTDAEENYLQWGQYLEVVLSVDTNCLSPALLVEEYYKFNGFIYGEWLACNGLEIGLNPTTVFSELAPVEV